MRLAEKLRIVGSGYLAFQAIWVIYTFAWLFADQNPPYNVDVFYTVSVVIALIALFHASAVAIYHWRIR